MTSNLPVPYQAPQTQSTRTPTPQLLAPVNKNGWGKWVVAGILAIAAIGGIIYSLTSSGGGGDWSLTSISAILIGSGFSLLRWGPTEAKTIAWWALGGGALLAFVLMFFGSTAVEYRREQASALVGGQQLPVPPVTPLSAKEQASRLEREKQEAEVMRLRAIEIARGEAEAAEAARLATVHSSRLPTSVAVPHCNRGWSSPVIIPVGWFVRSGWGGASIKAEYLNNGTWKNATRVTITESVEAFRYCTVSDANAAIGQMTLAWSKN